MIDNPLHYVGVSAQAFQGSLTGAFFLPGKALYNDFKNS